MTRDLDPKDVKTLIESSDWAGVGFEVSRERKEVVEESDNVEEDAESGFYELEEGILVYLSENGTLYDVLSDEEDNVFLFNEDTGLFQAFQNEGELLFEEVDASEFSLIEEETEETSD